MVSGAANVYIPPPVGGHVGDPDCGCRMWPQEGVRVGVLANRIKADNFITVCSVQRACYCHAVHTAML